MVKSIWDLSKPRMTIPREDLLADLKAYGKTLSGKPSSGADYSRWRNRRFSADTFRRMFGSWENACKEAGISKPKKKHLYTFDDLFEYMEKVAEWRKDRPSIDDLKRYNDEHATTITHEAFSRRWGSYRKFILYYSQYKLGQLSKKELIKLGSNKRKIRKPISDGLRAKVLSRDNYACVDCGRTAQDGVKLHVHHIIPFSKGGSDELSNLATNCDACNLGKSDQIIK